MSTEEDRPPNAVAGDDVTIQLPVDSVLLDGTASSDDFGIVQYSWTSENSDVIMLGDDNARMLVENLKEGVYTFTLSVMDAEGQTDKDSVDVYVTGVWEAMRLSKV